MKRVGLFIAVVVLVVIVVLATTGQALVTATPEPTSDPEEVPLNYSPNLSGVEVRFAGNLSSLSAVRALAAKNHGAVIIRADYVARIIKIYGAASTEVYHFAATRSVTPAPTPIPAKPTTVKVGGRLVTLQPSQSNAAATSPVSPTTGQVGDIQVTVAGGAATSTAQSTVPQQVIGRQLAVVIFKAGSNFGGGHLTIAGYRPAADLPDTENNVWVVAYPNGPSESPLVLGIRPSGSLYRCFCGCEGPDGDTGQVTHAKFGLANLP
ncbi:MAG: hypothetical protein WC480_02660 [Patescibacteria group bacterium]